uniref:Transmembrane protein 81 n=1 Tax=Monopterus albus TaxID=43700 RepID=A0A3Q3JZX0_MONAL
MQHVSLRLNFLLFLLLVHCQTSVGLEEVDKVSVEVIVNSSPCSTTCGLGMKTQTLCLLKDSEMVSDKCRVRKVPCLEAWQCGLRTMTVTSGQRVEINCLGEVEIWCVFFFFFFLWFMLLWRYARGIISSDDSLFVRWEAPQLDRIILDPVSEKDAGTYCCDVQDTTFRRVKRVYWGVRVLPAGVINLDYENSLAQWESTGNQQNQTMSDQQDHRMTFLYMVWFSVKSGGFGDVCLFLIVFHHITCSRHTGFKQSKQTGTVLWGNPVLMSLSFTAARCFTDWLLVG